MRLINVGPGEMADRLTILALKILYGSAADKPTDHFAQERNALLTTLRSRELNSAWFEHVLELGAVNSALWRAEDALREYREAGNPKHGAESKAVIECAFRIQALNDRRAELVQLINQATGDHLGTEKI